MPFVWLIPVILQFLS